MVLYYEDVIRDRNVGITSKQAFPASEDYPIIMLFLMPCAVQALSRVQEFLGVPVRKLSSKHVKIHTRPLPDLVDNWEQVSQVLNGTRYGRFLADADYAK